MLRRGGGGWTTNTAILALSYYYFERLVWKRFGPLVRDGQFDIVHRVTPLSPAIPSIIAKRCRQAGVPFVLGPLNGGLPWPREFTDARRRDREWLSYVRTAYRLLPGYRSTRRDASAILIGSGYTWSEMPEKWHSKSIYLPENGTELQGEREHVEHSGHGPLRIVFVGRLVALKGVDMLIEAAAPLIRSGVATLTIVGDGPELSALKQATVSLQIESGVHFAGWVDNARVHQILAEHDLLGFPSIKEFGGGVVLESMAAGVVPLVVAYGGPSELVTPDCGYLVQLGQREQIVKDLREVLELVARDPARLRQKAIAAKQRVREYFTWSSKVSQVLEVYRWVLGEHRQKPHFGMPLGIMPDPRTNAAAPTFAL